MEVQYFSDEEIEENIENKKNNLAHNIKKPEKNNGYTISYITKVISKFKDDLVRKEFEMMIYCVILEDELIDFFKFKELPKGYEYTSWECDEIEKLKTFYYDDNYTYYSFELLCQHLKLFFSTPEKFYENADKF
jgi:hypothetical protein